MPFHSKLKLHEAVVFATKAHHGQVRKGSDVPYMIHPFETAQILTEAGCSDEVVIAGLLHDTLEDTTTDKVSNLCSLLRDYTAEGDTAWYLYEHDVPAMLHR